jgi:Flp pilus assembly protein TadB
MLTRRGIRATALRQDLAMLDRGVNDFLGGTLLAGTITLIGTLFSATLLIAVGARVPPVTVLPAAALLAGLLAWARLHDVHKAATQRRREFRRALSAYLDLVAMSVISGTGLPEALPTAASIGKGWPFLLLSDTLTTARDMSGPLAAAEALGRLGERIGIAELRDLSIALNLTGEQGARIAKTLIERAKTLRARDTADVQGRADERSASMDLPRVGIGFGFLLFVIYPLVVTVLRY